MEPAAIRTMIQCPFCFAIPTNKKFFSCTSSHKICEHCYDRLRPAPNNKKDLRRRCPMGDCLYSDPPQRNIEIEEMIRNYELEVNCKYYHDGCQVLDLRPAMVEHERRCGCREVECPNSECDTRLHVRQILSHIKEVHKDALSRDDTEPSDFTLTCLLKEEFQERAVSTWITVVWNHSNGQTFFPMFEKRDKAWFAWIYILANREEAVRWESVVRVRDEDREAAIEFTGPLFPVDTRGEEVMGTGKILAMSDKQVHIMKSVEGIKEEEMNRGFTSKIVITYDVRLKPDSEP